MSREMCRFGLIVTGKGEEQFLHDLLNRALSPLAFCQFTVVARVPQLRPVTSPKRLLKVTGTKSPPATREEEVGLKAFGFLKRYPRGFVLVIDDLEGYSPAIHAFQRYRSALDQILQGVGLDCRVSVHFLVNMMEAYYFAHSQAVNSVAERQVLAEDHATDVEQIGHPKGDLKHIWREFDELDHGKAIMKRIDLAHVLARPAECCSLRALLAWCVDKLQQDEAFYNPLPASLYCLDTGCKSSLTYPQ